MSANFKFTVFFSSLGNEWVLIIIIKKEKSGGCKRKPIWFKFVQIVLGSVNFCYMMKSRICLWGKWTVKAGLEINKSNTLDLFLADQARFHSPRTYCSHQFSQAAVVLIAREISKAFTQRQQHGLGVCSVAAGCWFSSRRAKGTSCIFCQILNKTRKYTVYAGEVLRPNLSFPAQLSYGASSYSFLSHIGYYKRLGCNVHVSICLISKQMVKWVWKSDILAKQNCWVNISQR